MTYEEVLRYFLIGALLVTAFVVQAFIYRYVRYSDWRATQPGRSLLYAKIALALILDLSLLRLVFGDDWPGRLIVTTICFYAIAASQTHLFVTLLRTQTRRKSGDKRTTDAGADPDIGADATHQEGSR